MHNSVSRDDMILVSKMYYYGGMSQNEIADMLGTSRPKISRILSLAKQRNIVEFLIDPSGGQRERMAEFLKAQYKLDDVLIAPSSPRPEQALDNLALLAGSYFGEKLKNDMNIGISFSTAVDALIRHFEPAHPASGATVYQILGGTMLETGFTDARDSVIMLADKITATPKVIHAPLVVGNPPLKELLLQEPEISGHFKALAHLDIALIGLGSSQPDQCLLYKAGYITLEESRQLLEQGLAADICARRMNDLGEEQETFLSERIVGIDLNTLRSIPTVIGIGAGASRVHSMMAAIHGKYISVLALDDMAAIALMAHEGHI